MRVVGIDLGSRRVGIAVTDRGGVMALPHATLERTRDAAADRRRLVALVRELEADRVVVGLPLSLSGAPGAAADQAVEEVEAVAALLDVPVEVHDERLTTVEAERSLREMGVRGRDKRAVVDQVAAAVMLQGWLDGPAGRRARVDEQAGPHHEPGGGGAGPGDADGAGAAHAAGTGGAREETR